MDDASGRGGGVDERHVGIGIKDPEVIGIQRARERQRRVGVVGRWIAAAVGAGDAERIVSDGCAVGLHGPAADEDVLGEDGPGGEAGERDGDGGHGPCQETAAEGGRERISGAIDK